MLTQAEPTRSSPAQEPLWRAAISAIRGTQEDYTKGELNRAIVLLAIPMMLELVLESVFGLVDIYFVGKLGEAAIGAVGLTGSLIILVFALAIGLSMGTTAMVARRIGEGDSEGAGVTAAQAILAGVGMSIVVSALGAFFARDMLAAMGAPPEVVAGYGYTAVLFGGSVTIFLLFLINAVFRGAGDAATAMRVLWVANGLNIILDPCLIFGWGPFPELGLAGAAWATTIGRGTGVALQLWILATGKRRVQVRWAHYRVVWSVMSRLLRVSATGILQFFVATAAWLGVAWIVTQFGSTELAGYTIGQRWIHFVILPAWGMSNAAATLVGQSLGAGDPARAEKAVWTTARYNMMFLGVVAVIFWFLARPLSAIFSDQPEVIAISTEFLRVVSFGYVAYGLSMVLAMSFNGAGDTDTPTWINFACHWCINLPIGYLLGHTLGWGMVGVYIGIVAAGLSWSAIGAAVFRLGHWKLKTV